MELILCNIFVTSHLINFFFIDFNNFSMYLWFSRYEIFSPTNNNFASSEIIFGISNFIALSFGEFLHFVSAFVSYRSDK